MVVIIRPDQMCLVVNKRFINYVMLGCLPNAMFSSSVEVFVVLFHVL